MIKKIVKYLREDYNRRTFIFTAASIIINLAFAIYNGIIGLAYDSIWHASIFVYYILLICIRSILVAGDRNKNELSRRRILNFSFVILVCITIAMIAPAVVLIKGDRTYDWGLIPAITSATYTTYSITMSILNISKVKTSDNIMIKQIRLINLIAALMSILVLQNTMILANGRYDAEMKLLSIYTTIGILLAIVFIEVYSCWKTRKSNASERDNVESI